MSAERDAAIRETRKALISALAALDGGGPGGTTDALGYVLIAAVHAAKLDGNLERLDAALKHGIAHARPTP